MRRLLFGLLGLILLCGCDYRDPEAFSDGVNAIKKDSNRTVEVSRQVAAAQEVARKKQSAFGFGTFDRILKQAATESDLVTALYSISTADADPELVSALVVYIKAVERLAKANESQDSFNEELFTALGGTYASEGKSLVDLPSPRHLSGIWGEQQVAVSDLFESSQAYNLIAARIEERDGVQLDRLVVVVRSGLPKFVSEPSWNGDVTPWDIDPWVIEPWNFDFDYKD